MFPATHQQHGKLPCRSFVQAALDCHICCRRNRLEPTPIGSWLQHASIDILQEIEADDRTKININKIIKYHHQQQHQSQQERQSLALVAFGSASFPPESLSKTLSNTITLLHHSAQSFKQAWPNQTRNTPLIASAGTRLIIIIRHRHHAMILLTGPNKTYVPLESTCSNSRPSLCFAWSPAQPPNKDASRAGSTAAPNRVKHCQKHVKTKCKTKCAAEDLLLEPVSWLCLKKKTPNKRHTHTRTVASNTCTRSAISSVKNCQRKLSSLPVGPFFGATDGAPS